MIREGQNKEERTTKRSAVKVRLYPDKEQQNKLSNLFGACRWVYNWGLALRRKAYTKEGRSLSYVNTAGQLTQLKRQPETDWLQEVNAQSLQASLRNLDTAFKNFFNKKLKAGYPQFKNKRSKQSASFPQNVNVENSRIRFPKIGWVKAKIHCEIIGTIKTVTVSKRPTGKYYASILIDEGICNPEPPTRMTAEEVCGIDLGLTHLAITDKGARTPNPRHLRNAEKNLRKCHKNLSRKKEGSKNRTKARIRLAKAYEKLMNARRDFQHKLSRKWVDESQAICTETLKVKNMLKNRRLAKHISDVSWHSLLRKVEYKSNWAGKHFVQIDTFFASSKTCSACNNKVDVLPLDVRYWVCPMCLTEHDRDINAAKNIRQEGIRLLQAAGQTVYTCGDHCKTGEMSAWVNEAGSPVL